MIVLSLNVIAYYMFRATSFQHMTCTIVHVHKYMNITYMCVCVCVCVCATSSTGSIVFTSFKKKQHILMSIITINFHTQKITTVDTSICIDRQVN